ncbi:hypothetical protein L6R52_07860 [Myxococcota bacterium]|nr:hypothetical protein [Myxococcota bacterium]
MATRKKATKRPARAAAGTKTKRATKRKAKKASTKRTATKTAARTTKRAGKAKASAASATTRRPRKKAIRASEPAPREELLDDARPVDASGDDAAERRPTRRRG